MITQTELTTSVKFGKGGIGTVGLTASVSIVGVEATDAKLTIQQLITEGIVIGSTFDKTKDITELPKVELKFNDQKSVDAMIECLQRLRQMMDYPFPIYCYAC